MSGLGEYLEAVTNANTVETVWQLHCNKMASYGFDRLFYGYTRYRTTQSLGDPQDFVVLSNHKSDYVETFLGKGLYSSGPMVRWALENDGACSWRMLAQTDNMTPETLEVMEFNQRMGVTAGYSVSFRSVSERSKGAIALTAEPGMTQDDVDAVWEVDGRDIVIMNNVLHLKLLTLPYSQRPLTKRQREVLQWVGDGKTTQDIAILLGLTPATVEKHLRLARETLDVETTAQAVLKAAFYNQMFVIEA